MQWFLTISSCSGLAQIPHENEVNNHPAPQVIAEPTKTPMLNKIEAETCTATVIRSGLRTVLHGQCGICMLWGGHKKMRKAIRVRSPGRRGPRGPQGHKEHLEKAVAAEWLGTERHRQAQRHVDTRCASSVW
ncbi:uncharacterized protein CC84DRAFT_424184 [Paraphaeosphaeria sporulosa]|uniref:Uncharacterized protein n=1 Tax=Paraphaeosphaeria sporulosa TaxID=1460663 RepID=A0A177BWK5_9PLEO|nr:uncharacterized protein CC84DRAFT_424184 [Paraphaeosphaeria sporulosa]OAF98746.1 hypothetical protein CC84DRAFT_424184 [Paraphaeosphaeria sporulosa]